GIFARGHQREIEVELGERRGLKREVVVIWLGFGGRRAELALLAGGWAVQIGGQVVEAVNWAQVGNSAESVFQFDDMRMERPAAVAPIDALAEGKVAGITEQAFHDGKLGAAVADHYQRCRLQ